MLRACESDAVGTEFHSASEQRAGAFELTALAAGALRRLELGALERASSLLARAVDLIERARRA